MLPQPVSPVKVTERPPTPSRSVENDLMGIVANVCVMMSGLSETRVSSNPAMKKSCSCTAGRSESIPFSVVDRH